VCADVTTTVHLDNEQDASRSKPISVSGCRIQLSYDTLRLDRTSSASSHLRTKPPIVDRSYVAPDAVQQAKYTDLEHLHI
jgi:hypothetical protein